jgi:hypothetical protein
MNHYETVIKMSKNIEMILNRDFGAQGKGAIEKAKNVQHLISNELYNNIKDFGRIRNQLVHEVDFEVEDFSAVVSLTDRIMEALHIEVKNHKKKQPQRNPDGLGNCIIKSESVDSILFKYVVPIGFVMFVVFYWIFFV